MAWMVQPLRVVSRAAQILIASGRPAQALSSSAVASGSAAARSSPTDLDEQLQRLGVVEHVEVDQPGAGQVGHPAPRRHQHRRRRGARQQRPDLGGVARVVEHDEHPAAGQHCPVPGRALVVIDRDIPAVHAEVTQEPGKHIPGRKRVRRRAEQVDVELAVGVLPAQAVRGVDRQGRLAETAGAGHHGDADRARDRRSPAGPTAGRTGGSPVHPGR